MSEKMEKRFHLDKVHFRDGIAGAHGHVEGPGKGAAAAEADELDGGAEWKRGAAIGPELGDGTHDAVAVRVEGALIPATPAEREIREVSYGVERGMQDALVPGL